MIIRSSREAHCVVNRSPKDFREPTVKRVVESGLSLRVAGTRLSLPGKTRRQGIAAAWVGLLDMVGSPHRLLTEREAELARVQREWTEVKRERDLLNMRPCPLRRHRRKAAAMQNLRPDDPVRWKCRVLEGSSGGFYAE